MVIVPVKKDLAQHIGLSGLDDGHVEAQEVGLREREYTYMTS